MTQQSYLLSCIVSTSLLLAPAVFAQTETETKSEADIETQSSIERIELYGDYSQLSLNQVAQSATIINQRQINQRVSQHLEDVLNLAPNVNFTSGASRGKYIQIRGIGERSQFSEPLNPSVGLVIDGMDVSGLGGMAVMLDTQQVEILRGPQATVFGSSGLAGVVNIISNTPTDTPSGSLSVSRASQNTTALAGAYGLTLDNGLGLRGAIKQTTSDGFVRNAFLQRSDTNDIDERSARLMATYAVSDTLDLTAQLLHVDVDNGYDAFSLDNDNVTLSDAPGKDAIKANALSIALQSREQWGQWRLQSSMSEAQTTYGYDEDWTYVGFHPWEYTSTDYYFRDRDNGAIEFQAESLDSAPIAWVAGLLHKQSQDALRREYTYNDSDFVSSYEPSSVAAYTQFTVPFEHVDVEAGVRVEQHQTVYADSNAFVDSNDETLVGGKIAIRYQQAANTIYGFVARGFKAGGFNPDERVPDAQRIYEAEYNWHTEIGVKSRFTQLDASLRLALFHIARRNTQISDYAIFTPETSADASADDSATDMSGVTEFIDIVDNADRGINQGIEAEFNWQINPSVDVGVNLGYLDATFSGYERANGEVIQRQRQAQAPKFSGHAFINMQLADMLTWHVSMEGKTSHRFSDGHDEINPTYALFNTHINMPLTGAWDGWVISAYIKNLTDKTYYVRGFGGFSNDPREYYEIPKGYFQFGAQRQTGVSVSYAF